MGYILNSPGPTTILNSSSTGAGEWYRVHPKLSKLSFQVIHTGTSVGATIGSTVLIEVSNDGVNAVSSAALSIAISGDTPLSLGGVIDAGWQYIRAKNNSIVAATAGSTGSGFGVVTKVAGQWRS